MSDQYSKSLANKVVNSSHPIRTERFGSMKHGEGTILHVAETWTGGIRTAIQNFISVTPELSHLVVYLEGDSSTRGPVSRLVSLFPLARKVKETLIAEQIDFVHFHSFFAGLLRSITLRKHNIKLIYTPHCFAFDAGFNDGIKKVSFLLERILSRFTTVYAISKHEAALAVRLKSREVVDGCNMPPETFPRETRSFKGERETLRVAIIGRVSEQKNPLFVIELAKYLKNYRIELIWLGDGPDLWVNQLRQARITVSGWLDAENLRNAMQEVDLVIFPSLWEGNPIAALEAGKSGLVVLASKIPALESLGYMTFDLIPEVASETIRAVLENETLYKIALQKTENVLVQNSSELQRETLLKCYRKT
jgi:glycosyltransferase involved in cell wall biosynthesis